MVPPELVIRPSLVNQPYVWIGYPLAIFSWFGALYLVTHPLLVGPSFATFPLLVGVYAWIVVAPVGVAIGLVSTRRYSIYVTASYIGHTSFSGTPIEYKRIDLARIVLFSERRYRGIYTPSGVLIPVVSFETIGGEELFRVSSRAWGLPDLRRLALACGVPMEGSWEDIRNPR